MAEKTAYDYTNEELVKDFMNACGRAGVSNSGIVIDTMAGFELEEASYLKEVVLSRLDRKKPPFSRGDRVRLKLNIRLLNAIQYWGPRIDADHIYTIWRVRYNNGRFFLEFHEIKADLGTPHYDATKFGLVPTY